MILIAGIMTLGATLALTLYAFFTKEDFTLCGGFLCCFSFILCIFGISFFFQNNNTAYIVYSAMGVLIYSMYIVYDT